MVCHGLSGHGRQQSYLTNSFSIEMELGDAADELSEMDRVAIYWRCVSEMNNRYGD